MNKIKLILISCSGTVIVYKMSQYLCFFMVSYLSRVLNNKKLIQGQDSIF